MFTSIFFAFIASLIVETDSLKLATAGEIQNIMAKFDYLVKESCSIRVNFEFLKGICYPLLELNFEMTFENSNKDLLIFPVYTAFCPESNNLSDPAKSTRLIELYETCRSSYFSTNWNKTKKYNSENCVRSGWLMTSLFFTVFSYGLSFVQNFNTVVEVPHLYFSWVCNPNSLLLLNNFQLFLWRI